MFALASGEGDASRHSSTAATDVRAMQRLNMIIGKQTRGHRLHGNVVDRGSRRLLASSLENLAALSLMLLLSVANPCADRLTELCTIADVVRRDGTDHHRPGLPG